MLRIRISGCVAAFALLSATLLAEERVDLSVVHRIKVEAFDHSKVMDHMFYLTDVNGPRLTNSPGFWAAAGWVEKQMTEYELTNVHQEKFPFGRGWALKYFSAHMLEPQYSPLIGFPLAWTESTHGVVLGEPVVATLANDADLEKFKGKLRGKIVMTTRPKELELSLTPLAKRLSDAELAQETMAPDLSNQFFAHPIPRGPNTEARRKFRIKVNQFLKDEGALVVLQYGYNGDGGTVFASSGGDRNVKEVVPPPTVALTPEHYNRIARLVEHKIPVKLQFDIRSEIIGDSTDAANVVAELEGSRKKDELVMVGGHLDSWHGGTGATDNAAGCAVAMEAMRILKVLNLPMDRTIRMVLWGGEEEGLLGSKAYVKQHFADPAVMELQPEHAKLSGYFNLDNGSGKIRGVFLQGNDMMRPIFDAWFAPFKDLGAGAISIRNTGSTDHVSFDAVGLPGFQFIQDPLEYGTRTHHSNMDVLDHTRPGDLMEASAIMASFLYNAATREEMLPRKPLPKPTPAKRDDERVGRPPAATGN
ncbi:MAG TPA: M20/M25/M40 family metallo-hydrolase [Bryobacteraceae bacterium]|nr:M20/M25/M40 family metallo-hydrolase [Bryobacteraceae bacterium]